MSVGEYLAVFASIILGLAVADLALSLHRLIRAGRKVRWDWLSPAVAIIVLLNLLATWWVTFAWYRSSPERSIMSFLPDVTIFILIFLGAAAALPDEVPEEGLDLRQYYFGTARYFWIVQALMMGSIVLFVGPRYNPEGWLAVVRGQWENIVSIPILVSLAFSRRLWLHQLIIAAILIYLVAGYAVTTMQGLGAQVEAIDARRH